MAKKRDPKRREFLKKTCVCGAGDPEPAGDLCAGEGGIRQRNRFGNWVHARLREGIYEAAEAGPLKQR